MVSAINRTMAIGLGVLAGAALLETALLPGFLIGGAAALAPKFLPRYLPTLRRHRQSSFVVAGTPGATSAVPRAPNVTAVAPTTPAAPAVFGIRRAIAKTITFRIIVTTLDFTTNFVVIGELATAAGLSTFNLIAGPLFYLVHESAWNYLGHRNGQADTFVIRSIPIGRALAKTVTFRSIATTMDFATNYVVVGDAATAAALSAFGFVVGPFVYFGHEKLWDRFGSSPSPIHDLPQPPR